ncbi:MAG: Lon-like protease helical domain-containing protein [Synechococcus sp.]
MGSSGTGRHTFVRQFIKQTAANRPTPSDWCYVNNFAIPRKPVAIELPAGCADKLRKNIHRLMEEIQRAIPKAFESDKYHKVRQLRGKQGGF